MKLKVRSDAVRLANLDPYGTSPLNRCNVSEVEGYKGPRVAGGTLMRTAPCTAKIKVTQLVTCLAAPLFYVRI
jgi:hypothetical protein